MTTNSLNDFSTTPALNTDIAGTSIAVGCAPADVGIYMRTLASFLAYAVQGSGGAVPATWHVGTLFADNLNVSSITPAIWQVIQTVSVSGTNQTFLLPSNFTRFRLTMQGIQVTSSGAFLGLQFSNNAGVSYISLSYAWVFLGSDSTNASSVSSAVGTDSSIPLCSALLAGTQLPMDGTSDIYPGTASIFATVRTNSFGFSNLSHYAQTQVSGSQVGTVGPMTALKIFATAGNISGTMILEGLV